MSHRSDTPFDQAEFEPVVEARPNVYADASSMTRSALLGQLRAPALEQALAFMTYRDLESAESTLRDFDAAFAKRYGR